MIHTYICRRCNYVIEIRDGTSLANIKCPVCKSDKYLVRGDPPVEDKDEHKSR